VCIGSGKAMTLVQKNATVLQDSVTAMRIKERLAIDSLSAVQLNDIKNRVLHSKVFAS
jgi:hypothetical protein